MGRGAEPPAAIPGEPLKTTDSLDPVSAAIASTAATTSAVATSAPAPVQSRQRGRVKIKEGSLLATRAQDEYAYIAKDLRQIAITAAILFGTLILLWLLFTVIDPLGLY